MAKDLDTDIRARQREGDVGGAVTAVLEAYGEEVSGYLLALHRDPDHAADVYSLFCEDVLRGLPSYRGDGLRAWCYAVASNASARFRRTAYQRRRVRLSEVSEVQRLSSPVRTRTNSLLRTEGRALAARLRERLSAQEQALLILRVDRGLSWKDVSSALAPLEAAPTPVAALRKRFERITAKLREWAKEERAAER